MAKRKRFNDVMLLAPGEHVLGPKGCYHVDNIVATGAFGAVYSATDPGKPGRRIALKESIAARNPRENKLYADIYEREKKVGEQASPHPLMPTLYDAFVFENHYYIAMEYIEGTTLEEIIKKRHPLPKEWIVKWSVSLCDALAFLHSRQVVHHDLKPANIRITPQGHLVLIDFGAAQYFGKGHENNKPKDLYGTEGYLPPEVDADGKWDIDVRTDIFALGCILFEMIAGNPPDQQMINERALNITTALMEKPNADLNLVRLINNAISFNTEHRYRNANDFLMDMRKFAPPVLLVDKKHLRFGDVPAGQLSSPIVVTLYNAGGGTMSGEIKPRVPWIQVHQMKFQGNKREIEVRAAGSKTPDRNKLMVGHLEINNKDSFDHYDNVTSAGDRWFVECSVTVTAPPGKAVIVEQPTPESAPLLVSGRKGTAISGTFNVKNVGEMPVELRIGRPEGAVSETDTLVGSALTLAMNSATLEAGQTTAINFQVATKDLPIGIHHSKLVVRTATNQTLNVKFVIKVQSPMEFITSKIRRS